MSSTHRVLSAALIGLIGILGFTGLPARGSSLDLSAQPPDLAAGYINVTYNATAGTLSAVGWPASFNLGGSPPDLGTIESGQYDLTAHVTPSGQPISGSLDVIGTIPGMASSGTLLTGQLQLSQSGFGFQPGGGDIFEFIFNITGGDLAPYYQGKVSVILDAWNSGFNGSFANDFNASPYLSLADNSLVVVPEPTATMLLLTASTFGLLVAACRWRRELKCCLAAAVRG